MNGRFPLRIAVPLCCTLCLSAASAPAEIYQYRDESGKIVFSEHPPSGGVDAQIVKPKITRPAADAADRLKRDRERIVSTSETDAKAAAPQRQQPLTPEQEEQKARACAQAREALALLQENNRPRYETEDGQIAHMTTEMHAERIADAEEKIRKYCTE